MSVTNSEIYVYKIVVDNGGAPCVRNNLLSLALCKPKIRKSAEKGSLIFAFGGKEYQERLIYIARITHKLAGDAYYCRRRYARRPDCIYHVTKNRPVLKPNAKYHRDSDHRKKDVGRSFEKVFVLLSNDFRYLGRRGSDDYKERYPAIRKLIESLTQGHRRFHFKSLWAELMELQSEVWKKYRRKKVGSPTEADRIRPCNRIRQVQAARLERKNATWRSR